MSSVDDPEYHIILALQKMGIYMERDKTALAALSAKDQATRLQSAFDKAVETCCILPLLFNKKELRPGKLKLSHRKKWTGWDESRRATYLSDTDRFRGSVKAIGPSIFSTSPSRSNVFFQGDHSLWGPFRIARYSVEV